MKWFALLAFGLVGLAAFVSGLVWGAKRFSLWRDGVRTTGTVVEIYESHSTRTENGHTHPTTSYYPVVEFTAGDGKTYRFKGSTGSSSPDYEAGAKAELTYNKANPSVAQLTDFTQFWLGPLAVTIFGFMFLGAGIGSFFLVRDNDRTFGPDSEFRHTMARAKLFDMKKGIKLDGRVREVRQLHGPGTPRYAVVCSGGAPGGTPREFVSAPLSFDPGHGIIGKSVEIYADPDDPEGYYVRVEPLFQQQPAPEEDR